MKNKTYRPVFVWIILALLTAFCLVIETLMNDNSWQRKTIILFGILVFVFFLTTLTWRIKVTNDEIIIKHSVWSSWGIKKEMKTRFFKPVAIKIDDISSIKLQIKSPIIDVYLKTGEYVYLAVGGYPKRKEIVKLFQNLQMEIRTKQKDREKTADGSVSPLDF